MSFEEEMRKHKVKVLLQEPVAMAKQRLINFAASLPSNDEGESATYEELIERATAFQKDGDYWSEGGRFEGEGIYDKFWDDYKLVTGKPVNEIWGFFSCSC